MEIGIKISVTVSDRKGNVAIDPQPVFTSQPTGASVAPGANVTLSATVTDADSYQWYKKPSAEIQNTSLVSVPNVARTMRMAWPMDDMFPDFGNGKQYADASTGLADNLIYRGLFINYIDGLVTSNPGVTHFILDLEGYESASEPSADNGYREYWDFKYHPTEAIANRVQYLTWAQETWPSIQWSLYRTPWSDDDQDANFASDEALWKPVCDLCDFYAPLAYWYYGETFSAVTQGQIDSLITAYEDHQGGSKPMYFLVADDTDFKTLTDAQFQQVLDYLVSKNMNAAYWTYQARTLQEISSAVQSAMVDTYAYSAVSGATSDDLALTGVDLTDNGDYYLVATNPGGGKPSDVVSVLVDDAPVVITDLSASTSATAGDDITLTVELSGDTSGEWEEWDGDSWEPLSPVVSAKTLSLSAVVTDDDSRQFHYTGDNPVGSVSTTATTLSVASQGTISLDVGSTVFNVDEGDDIVFVVNRGGGSTDPASVEINDVHSLTNEGNQVLSWADGETGDKQFTFTAINVSSTRIGTLRLINESAGVTLGTSSAALVVNDYPGDIRLTSGAQTITEGQSYSATAERVNGAGGATSANVVSALAVDSPVVVTWENGESGSRTANFVADAVDGNQVGTAALADGGSLNGASIISPSSVVVTVNESAPSGWYTTADALADWEGDFSTLNPPVVPSLSEFTRVDVTKDTSGLAAMLASDSNLHIRLTAGNYKSTLGDSFALGGANKVIELADGVEMGRAMVQNGLDGVWFKGETAQDGIVHDFEIENNSDVVQDLLIDGITIDTEHDQTISNQWHDGMILPGDRIAIISCRMNVDGYGWYAADAINDLIWANCLYTRWGVGQTGATHPFRWMGIQRGLVVDVLADSRPEGTMIRLHGNSQIGDEVLVKRYQVDASDAMQIGRTPGPAGVGDIRIRNCIFHRDDGGPANPNGMEIGGAGQAENLTMSDNTVYGGTWPGFMTPGSGSVPAGWSMSNQTNGGSYSSQRIIDAVAAHTFL